MAKKKWDDMTKEERLEAFGEYSKTREGRTKKNTAKRSAQVELQKRHQAEYNALRKAAEGGQDLTKVGKGEV